MPYMWRWQISYNGAGTFSINTVGNPVVTGTTISSTWANALTGDLATGLTTCLLKDGTQTATAAIPFAVGLTTPTGYGLAAGGSNAILGYYNMVALADQSITTNTVLATATSLGFSIAASEVWVAEFYITVGSGLSTTGAKFSVTVPAGGTSMRATATYNGLGTSIYPIGRTITTSGSDITFAAADVGGATQGVITITVNVFNGATAGTVQLQVAQETSSGTALVLQKGSHGIAWRKS